VEEIRLSGDSASDWPRGLAEKSVQHHRQAAEWNQLQSRAATRRHGPAMRFVASVGDWDHSLMVIPGGQSGQLGSSHYADQFRYWYQGKPVIAPFSDAAEAAVRKHALTLKP